MANEIRKPQGEDIVEWADGTWCLWEELEEMLHGRSDDFRVIPFGSAEYIDRCSEWE